MGQKKAAMLFSFWLISPACAAPGRPVHCGSGCATPASPATASADRELQQLCVAAPVGGFGGLGGFAGARASGAGSRQLCVASRNDLGSWSSTVSGFILRKWRTGLAGMRRRRKTSVKTRRSGLFQFHLESGYRRVNGVMGLSPFTQPRTGS